MPLIVWWIWAIYIIIVLALAVGMAMMAGQKQPKVQAKTLEVPTTEIGKPIGVLFGTRLILAPHVVWWGDLRIKKVKVSTKGKK